jgi:hypothetical protein
MKQNDFVFMFEDGPKHSRDMTREDLLKVIESLLGERNWWKGEAQQRLADSANEGQ